MSETRRGRGEADSGWNRRDFLALGTGALLVATLPRAFGGRRRPLVRRTVPAMGSFAEIAVPAEDERWAQAAIDAALSELRVVEARLTRFSAESDVGRANRASPGAAIPVNGMTADALEAALAWADRSEGRFDPCLARAVALWDVNERTSPPLPAEARRFADRSLWRALEVDRSGGRAEVRLHDPDAGIDLGGIGKGIGVDRAVAALRRHGVRDALVNLGGDLYALGRSDDGDPWEIGVRSPTDPTRLAMTLRASDEAVATSGDYEQRFEHRGRRYHHLLDARTGEPVRSDRHSLTVVARTCADADAAATALFGLDGEAAARAHRRTRAAIGAVTVLG